MMDRLRESKTMEAAERIKLEEEIRVKEAEVVRIQNEVEQKDEETRRLQVCICMIMNKSPCKTKIRERVLIGLPFAEGK
jgi:shikimate kinase